jgi:cytochrome b involved in lipid metabolism
VVIDRTVYDVTPMLRSHSGGMAAILLYAGSECGNVFKANHDMSDPKFIALLLPMKLGTMAATEPLEVLKPQVSFSKLKEKRRSLAAAVEATAVAPTLRALTLAEVKRHSTPNDLWVVLRDKVYDVTSLVQSHPGGAAAITDRGGKGDSWAIFDFNHTSRSKARTKIEAYCIGTLGAPTSAFGPTVDSPQVAKPSSAPTFDSPGDGSSLQVYEPEEVMKHNTRDDCWLVYRRRVYDVTSFLPTHPGGFGALLICAGKDATSAIDANHDLSKGSVRESLATLCIGQLPPQSPGMKTPLIPQQAIRRASVSQPGARRVTMDEVRKHTNAKDCWIVYDGKAYDITPILSEHPGGPGALIISAGHDATIPFESNHRPDSDAFDRLRKCYVGDVE